MDMVTCLEQLGNQHRSDFFLSSTTIQGSEKFHPPPAPGGQLLVHVAIAYPPLLHTLLYRLPKVHGVGAGRKTLSCFAPDPDVPSLFLIGSSV